MDRSGESAQTQDVRDVDTSPNGKPGLWAGLWRRHWVFASDYDATGLTCITWGAPKKMT